MRQILLVVLSAAVLGLGGCGGEEGPVTVTVSGKVTLNDQPLPKGEIIFRSEGGDASADAGAIEGGQYSFQSKPGKKRVEIRAMRQVPGSASQTLESGETGAPLEQYIPEEYNDKTTLSADVTESGENTFEFPLTAETGK